MNGKILVPAAALALLVSGTARAQNAVPPAPMMFGQSTVLPGAVNTVPSTPAFNGAFNGAFSGFNNGFNPAFNPAFSNGFNPAFNNGFNPAFNNGLNPAFNNGFNGTAFNNGFNPFTGTFDPTFGGTVNPFNNGFNPGFVGNPFGFYGGYGSPYGGVYQSGMPDSSSLSPSAAIAARARTRRSPMVPVIGVNTVAPPPPGRPDLSGRTRVDTTPKTPEDFAARRLIPDQDSVASHQGAADQTLVAAGTVVPTEANAARPAPGAEVRRAPATPDQARLAAYAQQLMANRPMREGLVVSVNGDTVDVSYQCNGESRQDTFPAGEVFFFRPSGALTTASMTRTLKVSDRVLVACEAERPRQAVAGMRQEMRSSDTTKSPASTGSTNRTHTHK
jgi:hypothetical protein